MEKVYFAHPMNSYGTMLEAQIMMSISKYFPGAEIENPNQPVHQRGCEEWREKNGEPMGYFLELMSDCNWCAVLPFRDGMWGMGTAKEARRAFDNGCGVLEIVIMENNGSEMIAFKQIFEVPKDRVLSVDETRARLRDADGNWLPY